MHLKDIIKTVLLIGAFIALIYFGFNKFIKVADDNYGSAVEENSSKIDYVENY